VRRDTQSKLLAGSCSRHDGVSPSGTDPPRTFSSLRAGFA
jgi:hypothetical protein